MLFRNLILLIYTLASFFCIAFAQPKQYVMLPETDEPQQIDSRLFLNTFCTVNKFELYTEELYKTDFKIELYNFLFTKSNSTREHLMLFSVLPDFKDGSLWEEVSDTCVLQEVKGVNELRRLFLPAMGYGNVMAKMGRKFFNEFVLIKKDKGKFYQSKHTLMEMFDFRPVNPTINSIYGILNPLEKHVRLVDFIKDFDDSFDGYDALRQFYPNRPDPVFDEAWRIWKEYLSQKINIKGKEAYQFWTFAPGNTKDYYNHSTGINRFVYLPKIGIVAGSYDFYFHNHLGLVKELNPDIRPTHQLTEEELENNILEEKMMWSEEFIDA